MAFSTASDIERTPFKGNRVIQISLVVFVAVWITTLAFTSNLGNWLLENTLVFLFFLVLVPTYKKFKFSDLSYVLIAVFLCLHVYGSMNTYAENPFGFWLQDKFNLERNHYDRIVHFGFGLLLAYGMRDYFMNFFKPRDWVTWVLPCIITITYSGLYELIEWTVAAIFFPEMGMDYLGTQGDEWDGQKDMALALSGAISCMLITFSLKKIFKK